LYTLAGFENKYFNASFRALQPIVAAMVRFEDCLAALRCKIADNNQIFKATHKIADHSVVKHGIKTMDPFLVVAAVCTAINSALHINMFVWPNPDFKAVW
jgi:hypothetical protein